MKIYFSLQSISASKNNVDVVVVVVVVVEAVVVVEYFVFLSFAFVSPFSKKRASDTCPNVCLSFR